MDTHGVAIVPASRLRQAPRQDRLLSDADVRLLAATPASGVSALDAPSA